MQYQSAVGEFNDSYNQSDQDESQDNVDTKFMGLSEFLHNALQLFVWFEQIVVDFVHLFRQLHYLFIWFVDQLIGNDQTFLPSSDAVNDPVDLSVYLFVDDLPLLHFGQLHLGWIVVPGLVWYDAVVLLTFCGLEQLLSHFSVGFILVTPAYQFAIQDCGRIEKFLELFSLVG